MKYITVKVSEDNLDEGVEFWGDSLVPVTATVEELIEILNDLK